MITLMLTMLALFAGYQMLNNWLKDHPAVPDSPASLVTAK